MIAVRFLALALAAWLLDPAASDGLQVGTLIRDGRVHVSCTLAGAIDKDLEEAVQSGLITTFTYDVELRRPVSVWFDRTVAQASVSASVQRDTLAGRYQLTRTVDGRIEDTRVAEDWPGVARFVGSFARLPLFTTAGLEPNAEYYIKVRVRTRPRVTWFAWPWDRDAATGFARFTFIP